jgi:hypothetical protein
LGERTRLAQDGTGLLHSANGKLRRNFAVSRFALFPPGALFSVRVDHRQRHGLLAFDQVPPCQIRRDDVGQRIAPVQLLELGLDFGDFAGRPPPLFANQPERDPMSEMDLSPMGDIKNLTPMGVIPVPGDRMTRSFASSLAAEILFRCETEKTGGRGRPEQVLGVSPKTLSAHGTG